MPEHAELPVPLQAVLDSPPLDRKGWLALAPTFSSLFLWVVFFDQLGRRTLPAGGLGWSIAGSAVAGLLCYLLLYYVPAAWGHKTGRPLTVLASSTFGVAGTIGLTFFVFGLAQVVVMAIATLYSVDWAFQGLSLCGLVSGDVLDPVTIAPGVAGVEPFELRSSLVQVTSLVWIYAAALTGHFLLKIISALMKIYPIFPAFMLGLAVILSLSGVSNFQPLPIEPEPSIPVGKGGWFALLMTIQMIFGFFAIAGAGSADWGTVSRSMRDVRLSGWIGVALASWIVATLSLVTVSGVLARESTSPQLGKNVPGVEDYTVHAALVLGFPSLVASAIFLVFALSSLAYTCYAASLFGRRFSAIFPRVSQLWWTLIGATAAWPMVVTGAAIHLEAIFTALGAVFSPMIGAMAGEYVRNRGVWPGPRQGINLAGLISWAVGLGVGLLPFVAPALGWTHFVWLQPASVYAFGTAFFVYLGLGTLGAESSTLPLLGSGLAADRPEGAPTATVDAGLASESG